jgi:hypothetical protein
MFFDFTILDLPMTLVITKYLLLLSPRFLVSSAFLLSSPLDRTP